MRRWFESVSLALGVLLLAGCTLSSGGSTDEAQSAPAPAIGQDGAVESVPEVAGNPDRDIISQGYLAITAEDPIEAADDAVRIVERTGGRIDSRTEQPPNDAGESSSQLVARIPSADLTAILDEIKDLGEYEQGSITSTDVTTETQDLGARITALRASVARLLALLETSTTTADLIEIETALSTRQAELERLEAQQRSLADRVDLATVSVEFGSEVTAPIDRPQNFFSGLLTGWEALLGFFAAVLIVLGVALPWLALAAIVAAGALIFVRRPRRGRRSSDSPPAITTEE